MAKKKELDEIVIEVLEKLERDKWLIGTTLHRDVNKALWKDPPLFQKRLPVTSIFFYHQMDILVENGIVQHKVENESDYYRLTENYHRRRTKSSYEYDRKKSPLAQLLPAFGKSRS